MSNHSGKDSKFNFENLKDNGVFIIAAQRTPVGTFGGSLASYTAPKLAAFLIEKTLSKYNINKNNVDEVIFGNVYQGNLGQNCARQATIFSGLPSSTPATTVNKICSSGLKAVTLGAQSIQAGTNHLVVTGGVESMTNAPYYLPDERFGARMGHKQVIDGMIKDGLWDVFTDQHMGSCAEHVAKVYNISRQAQDDFAIRSYKLAQLNHENGNFADEIIPVPIASNDKDSNKNKDNSSNNNFVKQDEGCFKLNEPKLRNLKGAFDKENGTVTPGNSSQLSDGAAVVVLASGKYLKSLYQDANCESTETSNHNEKNQKTNIIYPIAEILSYADAEQDSVIFPVTPSIAIPIALKRAKLDLTKDIDFKHDYFEINEAFAVAGVANSQLLKIPVDNINIFGGSVAIGHPLGCSGARILVTLCNILKKKNGRYGIAGVCNGGGGATAVVVKNIDFH